jgi:hypothetical protein
MNDDSSRTARPAAIRRQEGIALITTLMVLTLCSVLVVGFVTAISSDQRSSGMDRDQTQAYAAAHAGLENLTADLTTLFTSDFSPQRTQIEALAATPPAMAGFQFIDPTGGSGYRVGPTRRYSLTAGSQTPHASGTFPIADPDGTIAAGPYQGFRGLITPYEIVVTARSRGGAEVRLRRELQTVAIPVFQFGMFSETDLAFHAGEDFLFGGRVHTNGDLWLAQGNSATLTLNDRVTAVGEVIRTNLPNGLATTTIEGYNGTVNLLYAANKFRPLKRDEGSLKANVCGGTVVVPNPGASLDCTQANLNEGKWTNTIIGAYNSYLRNGRTGARQLDLPLVADGNADGQPDYNPIELVRRPSTTVADPALLFEQRFFSMASVRILLSDTAADITGLPTVTADAPYRLDGANEARYTSDVATGGVRAPLAASAGPLACGIIPAGVYKSDDGQPLLNGYIKVEMKRQDGTWVDVTGEMLNLGISGRNLADNDLNNNDVTRLNNLPDDAGDYCAEPNPNAVIRLQRLRDAPSFSSAAANRCTLSTDSHDYWPLTLYDAREGQMRDGLGGTDLAFAGIMHYVELDVANLRRWLLGQIGASGTQARNDNGYIVYFSDRRNNRDAAGNETGEFGFEDVVNPPNMVATAGVGNSALDTGEDVNGNGLLDTYGAVPPAGAYRAGATAPFNAASIPRPYKIIPSGGANPDDRLVARANGTLFFRRALKLVNGGALSGNAGFTGLTIAAENPVYIQGNYNATTTLPSPYTEAHIAAAVIADAVTLLSNNWNDIRSFNSPSDATARPATSTAYRTAIITGKGIAFPKPAWADNSFGSDGGAHNFVRGLEDWRPATQRYRGSFVSFFTNRQATGTFKCCQSDVYVRGDRSWTFDTDFLTPTLLPPATPMFRDVNTLTFRQLLRPNQ